ncbi:DUF4143 domain-containing protein [bacterium]|nr:DUF4143 domain-containing protein [bacterium]
MQFIHYDIFRKRYQNFCDPALCSCLLGFNDAETLLRSLYFGNLFEAMIITPKYIM